MNDLGGIDSKVRSLVSESLKSDVQHNIVFCDIFPYIFVMSLSSLSKSKHKCSLEKKYLAFNRLDKISIIQRSLCIL